MSTSQNDNSNRKKRVGGERSRKIRTSNPGLGLLLLLPRLLRLRDQDLPTMRCMLQFVLVVLGLECSAVVPPVDDADEEGAVAGDLCVCTYVRARVP